MNTYNLIFHMQSGVNFSVCFETDLETKEEVLEYFSDLERKTADARYVFRDSQYPFICIHLNCVEALEING